MTEETLILSGGDNIAEAERVKALVEAEMKKMGISGKVSIEPVHEASSDAKPEVAK